MPDRAQGFLAMLAFPVAANKARIVGGLARGQVAAARRRVAFRRARLSPALGAEGCGAHVHCYRGCGAHGCELGVPVLRS